MLDKDQTGSQSTGRLLYRTFLRCVRGEDANLKKDGDTVHTYLSELPGIKCKFPFR